MADVTNTDYAADALIGKGAQWLIGDGASPETFEAVYGVRRITPGRTTTNIIDKTHLRSPNNHTEKMAGRRDSEGWTIEMIYNPLHESHTNAGGGSGSFTGGGIFAMHIAGTELNHVFRVETGSPDTDLAVRGIISDLSLGELSDQNLILLTATVMPLRDYLGDLP